MKVLMLSHSNGGGGAGRATQRLFSALDTTDAELRMHVDFKLGDDPRIFTNTGPLAERRRSLRITIDEIPAVTAGHPHPELFSPATQSAISAQRIDALGADIVDVHWLNFGYLSIEQLSRITTPLVWHMHDMWAFTGGDNYTDDGPNARWRSGYTTQAPYPLRWDIERWVHRRKQRHWQQPRHLIASSSWMASLARESSLLQQWPVHVIPNPIDTDIYAPGDKARARDYLGLPQSGPILVVVLPSRIDDRRKGFDLLQDAIARVQQEVPAIQLAVVGHSAPPADWRGVGVKTYWLGHQDDAGCIEAYRAADVVAVPSRQDNSPQTATEALSCGTPVAAFDVTGLPDFVTHKRTGFLARAEDSQDLARGLTWMLTDTHRLAAMGSLARETALAWSHEVVAKAHLD
jgi:glycosyltransferase involved in cell wall biosynthesis